MSERKTIQINPELFKVSGNSSRKKTPKPEAPAKIKIKSAFQKQNQKTLRKNVLKMIREKQQEAYKELFDTKRKPVVTNETDNKFQKDFDESLNFFSTLATKIDAEQKAPLNTTFKNTSTYIQPVNIEPVSTSLPEVFMDYPPVEKPMTIPTLPRILPPPPSYGCLKGGALPTYRAYTRRIGPVDEPDSQYAGGDAPYAAPPVAKPLSFVDPVASSTISEAEKMKKFEAVHGGMISKENHANNKIKYLKRKKIFKRTYHVGRTRGSIGVLVSNKTIRNRISTEAQLLKQTPIQDVRKFLIKKGFIKVGTNAPNDVLRKMYESVSLVCGEVQNHNQENLLYNFINDTA